MHYPTLGIDRISSRVGPPFHDELLSLAPKTEYIHIPLMTSAPPSPAIDRFLFVINQLLLAISERIRIGPLPIVLGLLIDKRVRRIRDRFLALAAKLQAGTLRPPRERRVTVTASARPAPLAPGPLPHGFGWLARLVPGPPSLQGIMSAAGCGEMLRQFLVCNAEMSDLVAADPRFGRVLRPLLSMLAVRDMPDVIKPKPMPRRTAAAGPVVAEEPLPASAARPGARPRHSSPASHDAPSNPTTTGRSREPHRRYGMIQY